MRGGETLQDPVRGAYANGGLYGERMGWSLPGFPDSSWASTTLPSRDKRAGVSWYRTQAVLDLPRTQDTSVGLTITDNSSRKYRAALFVNGWQIGNYVNYVGPQHSFPVPNGILKPNGTNDIAIAVWNLDGTSGGLGKVALTNYGSHVSPLSVATVYSPRYDRVRYAAPATPGTTVSLKTPDTVGPAQTFTATATVSATDGKGAATDVIPTLTAPQGWTVGAPAPATIATLRPGTPATVSWSVTTPDGTLPQAAALTASVTATQREATVTSRDERIVGTVPSPPPAGQDAVSDLPFVSSSNGWGPVERDESNGENVAGDGRTLTIQGTTYAKGLGTNSLSTVRLYLGGHCSRFTASVGVDDEVRGGSVTFSVLTDGQDVVTTPVLGPNDAARSIDVSVAGAQFLDLVVGDGGDGNGMDHGDWGAPTLTCT